MPQSLPTDVLPTPGSPGSPGSSPPPTGSAKLLIAAIALAVLAVVLMNLYVAAARRSIATSEFPVFRLLVRKNPGQRLAERDVQRIAVPNKFEDTFAGAIGANDQGQPLRIGDTFTRPVEPQDILLERHFDALGEDESRLLIKKGWRGKALPVDAQSLPDPLRPEMWVDLEAPFRGAGNLVQVWPVMERVRVVSVGRTSIVDERRGSRSSSGVSKITLEVRPEEASQLEALQTIVAGNFSIHLRRTDDLARPKIPDGGINPELLQLLSH